ncbi:MAG: hypothetical protein HN341_11920 [Verrucomicrobia bacterium]|nr:hypothetical protein [Verrucomicrobiota bacterium]
MKRASMRFDKLSHIIETLQPDSVVVMYRGMNRDTFFEGLDWCAAASDDPAIQHSIAAGVHVFNLPHPTGMRKRRKESFKEPLMALFHHNGLKFTRGSFLKHDAEVREFVHGLERRSAKEADKYACIELIAKQLDADGCIMSAQCLATILNDLGHLTDYGTAYKGARGTYRLIRGAYCRCERRGNMGLAAAIAKAFVKPNGTYAYG